MKPQVHHEQYTHAAILGIPRKPGSVNESDGTHIIEMIHTFFYFVTRAMPYQGRWFSSALCVNIILKFKFVKSDE